MKHILYAAAALLLLASCNKNDDMPQGGNYPADGAVRIATSLTAMQTRAGGATAYTGTDLSLSVDYGTDDKYTVGNVKWRTADAGTTWIPATQMLWKNATTATNIYAYAPHVAGTANITAVPFSVQTDQSAGLTSSDLVGCIKTGFEPSAHLVNNMVNLAFDHKLSKLTIDLSFGDQFDGTPTIERVTLTEALPTVSYNATTGVVSAASGTATPITMHAVNATKYDAILAPQTIAAGKQMITVVLAGSSVEYRYTVPTAGHTFATKTAYTMKLKVGKEKIELDGITVSDWTTGTPITGGEALEKIYLDPVFAAILSSAPHNIPLNDGPAGKYLDMDEPAVKTAVEAVETLWLDNKKITSLNGIQYFTNLKVLYCNNNGITTLDVSKLTNLYQLNCSDNSITTLDVSKLTSLLQLSCYNNSITTLDVSKLTNLELLYCSNNGITTLDVSKLTNLTRLFCSDNSITTLDVSNLTNLTYLQCSFNGITTLDVSKLTNLTELRCSDNSITTLDVSNLTNLTYLQCSFNGITTLDVSKLTNLTTLQCNNNGITTLDISTLNGLTVLYCGRQKENLDLTLTQKQYDITWKIYGTADFNSGVTTIIKQP